MQRERSTTTRMIGSLESTTVRVSPLRRRGRRSNDLICYINVTGLVSVMLALLFMFMVLPEHPHHGTLVDLARVAHPKPMGAAQAEDALIVGIMRDGKIFFRTGMVTPEQLPGLIREGVQGGTENRVYIRADARAKYGTIKDVLDAVRASGVEKIAFITDQRKPQVVQ